MIRKIALGAAMLVAPLVGSAHAYYLQDLRIYVTLVSCDYGRMGNATGYIGTYRLPGGGGVTAPGYGGYGPGLLDPAPNGGFLTGPGYGAYGNNGNGELVRIFFGTQYCPY